MKNKEESIQQIKRVFVSLDKSYKDEARQKISSKFNVSVESVNNRWMYEGKIPEANIQGVSAIIKSIANKQLRKLQKQILECI